MACADCPRGGEESCDSFLADHTDVVLIGNFPTRSDCRSGRLFSSMDGKILRHALAMANIPMDRVSTIPAVRCLPPKGGKPTSRDIASCSPLLRGDILQTRPRMLVPMGNEAVISLLGRGRGITKRRGVYRTVKIDDQTFGVVPTIPPQMVLGSTESFPDLVRDLQYVRSILDGESPVIAPPYDAYYLVDTQKRLELLLERLPRVKGIVASDIETTGLDPQEHRILSIAFCWQEGTGVVIDWEALIENRPENCQRLQEAIRDIPMAFHHGQFDVAFLRHHGLDVRYSFDTMLANYLLDVRQGVHSLQRLAIDRYRAPDYESELKSKYKLVGSGEGEEAYDSVPKAELHRYNAADCDYTYRLTRDLSRELLEEEQSHLMGDLLIPAAEHLMELERVGVRVDHEYLHRTGAAWETEMEEIAQGLRKYSGAEELNFRSPKQLSGYIFDTLGLRPMEGDRDEYIDKDSLLDEIDGIEDEEAQQYWKTASSAVFTRMKPRSTSTYMLFWLAQQHEFPRLLVKHRILGTRVGTYYRGLLKAMGRDGRVHPYYRINGTRTGRLSSSKPNVHGTARKKEIKNIYVADDGYRLVAMDYSQAEIRMIAHLSGDQKLISYLRAADIHREISKELFRLTDEELDAMTDEKRTFLRRASKTIAFGIIYGRGPASLAPQMDVTVDTAKDYVSRFFLIMPEVQKYIARQKLAVIKNHEAVSVFGRKRRFPLIIESSRHEAERQGVNMPIQSGVSDMTLMANLKVMTELRARGIRCLPGVHIHDGFVVQIEQSRLDDGVDIVRDICREVPFETKVPFSIELQVGDRWGEMQTVFEG